MWRRYGAFIFVYANTKNYEKPVPVIASIPQCQAILFERNDVKMFISCDYELVSINALSSIYLSESKAIIGVYADGGRVELKRFDSFEQAEDAFYLLTETLKSQKNLIELKV